MTQEIEQALNTAYTDGILAFDVQSVDNSAISGRFVGQEGDVYRYQIDQGGIEFERSDSDTKELNEYFIGRLDALGVEYRGDSAFEYLVGRFDAESRLDRVVKCKGGGTPCGGRCLPKGQKCRVGANGASKAAMKSPSGKPPMNPEKKAFRRGVATGIAGTLGTQAAVNVAAGATILGATALHQRKLKKEQEQQAANTNP